MGEENPILKFATDTAKTVGDAASSAVETVGGVASAAGEGISNAANAVGEGVSNTAKNIGSAAQSVLPGGENSPITEEQMQDSAQQFEKALFAASQLPGVKIDRKKYLIGALRKSFSPEVVAMAIETSPAAAGIDPGKLSSIADESIRYETTKVTALSTIAGIPGGLAMAGTVPADMAQYFAHILRIAQKLAYLYGWENLFGGTEEEIDDETKNLMILFIGVMFGANGAAEAIAQISKVVAAAVEKRLAQKALMKGAIYPVVKKVATYLGIQMTKGIFSKGVSKVIPVVGGLISGGITLATYAPMSLKLKDYLAGLEVADPQTYVAKIVEVQDVMEDESFEE